MAEPVVDDLVLDMYERVARHTGGRVGAQPPSVTSPTIEALLRRFAENRDIPARLASPGQWAGRDAADQRPQIRAALRDLVATCANGLESQESLPRSTDRRARDRLGVALSELYAEEHTRDLAPQLLENGRVDDLGIFEHRILEGDEAAARALTVALGARTRERAEVVVTRLVGAGRGAAAPTAARMLLELRPDYARLTDAGQREAVATVAATLETRFAARDPERVIARELTPEIENRREDITGGAGAIDDASAIAAREVEELHKVLDSLPEWEPVAVERPGSVPELMERIHGVVGELTDTRETQWDGTTQTLQGNPSEYTLRLTDEQAHALQALTEDRPLSPADVAAVRSAYFHATANQAWWAVPDDHTYRNEAAAAAVAPRFVAIRRAVVTAFAEDNFNEVVNRTLPAELAEQIRMAEAPRADAEYAPAARGLANTIDTATGRPEGSTLRLMAGQDRARMAMAAAQALTSESAIPRHEQIFTAGRIADLIDDRFDELPARLDSPESYGQRIGEAAYKMTAVDRPSEKPANTMMLIQRIQGAVGQLTGAPHSLWDGQYDAAVLGDVPARTADGSLLITFDAELALAQLTQSADRTELLGGLRDPFGDITPGQLTAARDGIADLAEAQVQWAVPDEGSRAAEAAPDLDVIAQSVRDAVVEDNLDEIIDRVLPADLADQVKSAESTRSASTWAPAARGLAQSIDEVTGSTSTLQRLAGQSRADIARTAAEALVPETGDRPAAAERINRAFQMLPQQVEAWREAGTTEAELPAKIREYGHQLAYQGAGDPHLRFAGRDAALSTPKAQAPVNAPASAAASSEQPTQHGRDAR